MEHSLKLIMIGVSLTILAMLIGFSMNTMVNVKRTTNAHTESLVEMQEEYAHSDLLALKNQIVTSAEAFSLARKYRYDASICFVTRNSDGSKEWLSIDADSLNESTFKQDANWIVNLETQETGALLRLGFESPSAMVGEPTTVEEMKNAIASQVGCNTDWVSITSSLNSVKEAEEYRKQFASIAGISENSSWLSVYQEINHDLGLSTGVSVDVEKYSLGILGSCEFKGGAPTFCYLVGGDQTGFLDCESGELFGDFTLNADYGVWWDGTVLSNYTGEQLIVTFVKQGF